jgi:Lipopolysaccharide-assembly
MKKLGIISLGILLLSMQSCWWYSFTGASIDPEIKTFSVSYFPNNAPLVQPTLSQSFTDALKEKLTSQTDLILVKSGGDLRFSGEITGYSTRPIAIQGNETAAMNRLSVTIKVQFENTFDDKQSFETSFTRYQDYESSLSLSAVEGTLIDEINEQLVEDVFNKAVVNW